LAYVCTKRLLQWVLAAERAARSAGMESSMTARGLRIFNAVATIYFLSFWGIALVIGDALQGHAEDGRFFLVSHGRSTEVGHAVFIFSKLHGISAIATVPLAMIVNLIWARKPAGDRSRNEPS
jgi:hypothetical protein